MVILGSRGLSEYIGETSMYNDSNTSTSLLRLVTINDTFKFKVFENENLQLHALRHRLEMPFDTKYYGILEYTL